MGCMRGCVVPGRALLPLGPTLPFPACMTPPRDVACPRTTDDVPPIHLVGVKVGGW